MYFLHQFVYEINRRQRKKNNSRMIIYSLCSITVPLILTMTILIIDKLKLSKILPGL